MPESHTVSNTAVNMSTLSNAIIAQLKQLTYYHLDHHSYDNALFFSERLAAQDAHSGESIYLLALCHFQVGDYRTAFEVSKASGCRGTHLNCTYIFARTCLVLERYKDGITALEKSRSLWSPKSSFGKHTAIARSPYPDSASILCLLGKLYKALDDKKKAILSFEGALKENPFMWDAFTALCDMGVRVRTQNVFKLNDALLDGLSMEQPFGVLAEQRDNGTVHPLDPLSKRVAVRSAVFDPSDPFDSQRPGTSNEKLLGNNFVTASSGENDFMSKIHAARSKIAAAPEPIHDPVESPTVANLDLNPSRAGLAIEPPQAPGRKTRNAQPSDAGFADAAPKAGSRLGGKRSQKTQEEHSSESNPAVLRAATFAVSGVERKRTVSGHPVQPRQPSEEPGVGQRRSARLNMFRSGNPKTNSGTAAVGTAPTRELKRVRPQVSRITRPTPSGTSASRAVSGTRKPVEEHPMDIDQAEAPRIKEAPPPAPPCKPAEQESAKVVEALGYLLDLLQKFGLGYYSLAQYDAVAATKAFATLPRIHQETPWVLSQFGRAHYEQASYAEAEKYYRRLRILAPTRLEDMEVYSTTLWHLKRETELAFLGHELVDSYWHSPQAWCALGNAWSLARDHEQALRCFKRATQLNPKFAYAFTLQGHEHVANEEYEKALTAYRLAISADRRHYNAYYGIGRVYEKLGSYDKAYRHFHFASVINPTNAVLLCCIGNALEKQHHYPEALRYFSKAAELSPRGPMMLYRKAKALILVKQFDAAKKELDILKTIAPNEATVHFLLGNLHRSSKDKSNAVRHYTIAMNLDPKAGPQIKHAIEKLEEDSSFVDDSMIT
ncbi:tetratricopeptide [Xylariaceae sp. FL0594]|nr:tetratricopeptide [Xylariaceae sp. FL0594]